MTKWLLHEQMMRNSPTERMRDAATQRGGGRQADTFLLLTCRFSVGEDGQRMDVRQGNPPRTYYFKNRMLTAPPPVFLHACCFCVIP